MTITTQRASSANDLPHPLDLVRQGALVVHNNSGGKDSQAMLAHLVLDLRIPTHQIISVHADLGAAEWEGVKEHAAGFAAEYNVPFHVTLPLDVAGQLKTIPDVALKRGMFPDKSRRWCTSDFKRGPIRRAVNQFIKSHDWPSPFILNCMGMRHEESIDRRKLDPIDFSQDASCPATTWPEAATEPTRARRRLVFDWHPILTRSEQWVFDRIAHAGQKPHHAYSVPGVRRLSCTVCIFSSPDTIRATMNHSAAARRYARDIIRVEQQTGHSILMPRMENGKIVPTFLADIIPDIIPELRSG